MFQVDSKVPDPTQISYHLRCKVMVKEISYLDQQSKKNEMNTEKMVFLVPEQGTQRDRFLSAWCPESENETFEIAMILGRPVDGPCRGVVRRASLQIDVPHIFVMSYGVEKDLISESEGRRWYNARNLKIEVEVLPEHQDSQADLSKDVAHVSGVLHQTALPT